MNTKAGAISSGCAARFIAVLLPKLATALPGLSAGLSGAQTGPGATALTRMGAPADLHRLLLLLLAAFSLVGAVDLLLDVALVTGGQFGVLRERIQFARLAHGRLMSCLTAPRCSDRSSTDFSRASTQAVSRFAAFRSGQAELNLVLVPSP